MVRQPALGAAASMGWRDFGIFCSILLLLPLFCTAFQAGNPLLTLRHRQIAERAGLGSPSTQHLTTRTTAARNENGRIPVRCQAGAAPEWKRGERPHVILIGSPMSGKTTMGSYAAARLGLTFSDMDKERGGKETTAREDAEALERLLLSEGQRVIACGGYAALVP